MTRWFGRTAEERGAVSDAQGLAVLLAQVRFQPRRSLQAEILGAARRSLGWLDYRLSGSLPGRVELLGLPLGALLVGVVIYLLWRALFWPGR